MYDSWPGGVITAEEAHAGSFRSMRPLASSSTPLLQISCAISTEGIMANKPQELRNIIIVKREQKKRE